MLHNPKWDKTRAGLIAFLESKPADEIYQWHIADRCACGQFFGHADWHIENDEFEANININLTALACATKVGHKSGQVIERTGTFGALLAKVKANEPVR